MAVIKSEVHKDFKNRVENSRKEKGITEGELVRTAVKNYLDSEETKNLSPLQRAWGKNYRL